MSQSTITPGTAVQFEYKDQYERETGTGIVVREEPDGFYRIVLIKQEEPEICQTCLRKMEEGKWFFANYELSLPMSKFKPLGKFAHDYGLTMRATAP